MAITIEGTAFPLGKINKNGWGIPTSEATSAIASLKKAVVRICPRDNGHGCDLSEDPNHEIGRVIDAWSTPTSAMVRVEISDKVAEQKILNGVWERTWSVYGKASSISEGWAQGFQARSLTLVRDPAWEEASFNVVASANPAGGLVLPGKYTVLSNNSSPGEKHMTDNNTEGNTPDKNPDGTEIAAIMTENQKLKEDLAALTASLDKLKEERDNASIAAASGIPADKFNEMVEDRAKKLAAVTMEQWKEEQEKNAATQKYTRAVMSAGLEPDRSVLKNLTSEQILNLAASYERLTPLSASRHFNIAYPTENSSLKSSVGRWNEAKKSWEDF